MEMNEKEKNEKARKEIAKLTNEYDLDYLTAVDIAYIRGLVDATVNTMKQMRKEKSA